MSGLTRIVIFVDDGKVGGLLRDLAGKVRSMEPPQPVINGAVVGGKMKAASGAGNLCELYHQHLIATKTKSVLPEDVRNWLAANGRTSSSYSYIIHCGKRAGFLKGRGTGVKGFNVVLPRKKGK